MSRFMQTFLMTAIILIYSTGGQGQSRPELEPRNLREVVQQLIPRMSQTVDVRVYEPIPIHIVDRNRLKAALAVELQEQLQNIQTVVMKPKPMARPVLFPDQAKRIADKVATHLSSLFLIRYVFDVESKLLVVPANLERLLDEDKLVSRQIQPLIQFALVRELTRLADAEKRRYAEDNRGWDKTLEMLAARLAFLEGRACWAASRLIRHDAKNPLTFTSPINAVTGEGHEADILLYATVGKGRERGRIWVQDCMNRGGFKEIRRKIQDLPTAFNTFPRLPEIEPEKPLPPDPLKKVQDAMALLCSGESWTSTPEGIHECTGKESLKKKLGVDFPPYRVKQLLGSVVRTCGKTAIHPSKGRMHLTVMELTNPSAAYAHLQAQRDLVEAREKRMAEEGLTVQVESSRTRDLPGYPILRTSHKVVDSGEDTMHIYRILAVHKHYFLEINSTGYEIPWQTIRRFLVKILPCLDQTEGCPG